MKVSYPEVMWHSALHFSMVEQIKLSTTVSVVISKTVFLSHSVSLFRCLIEISIDLWNLWHSSYLPSLPASSVCILQFLSLLVFCFLISVWTLSSHSLYIYTQINICVFQFLSIYISIILCHWCLYLFLRQKWAKMQWFNTVQRQYRKGLFKNNNWNDWNWLWPLKNYALLLPVMNLGFVAVLQFATVYLFSYFFISYFLFFVNVSKWVIYQLWELL